MIQKKALRTNMVICHSEFHPVALKRSTKRAKLLVFCWTFLFLKTTAQYFLEITSTLCFYPLKKA